MLEGEEIDDELDNPVDDLGDGVDARYDDAAVEHYEWWFGINSLLL